MNNTLKVNLIATMSAGKSTVLNALMSEEILPSQNIACTAVIFKIFNNKDNSYKAEIVGNNKIIESYTETENRSLLSKLKKINESDYIKENDIEEVRVYGKIPFIGDIDDNLILVDTPGPNNANNEDHGIVTQKMIMESDKDLVLYIMDVTTLTTDDSSQLLYITSKIMEKGGLQARDRIIFVVNKLDNLRKGESIEDILKEARKFIEKYGINNPNIYPVSGLSALELRKLQRDYCGNITSEDLIKDKKYKYQVKINEFNKNLHLEKYSSLGGMGKEIIERELQEAIDNNDIVSQAIIHTGIRSLEEGIKQIVRQDSNCSLNI